MTSPAPAGPGDLPPEAWLLALAALPEMGPARLLAATEGRSPRAAFDEVASGAARARPDGAAPVERRLARRWARALAGADVAGRWADHVAAGVGVAGRSSARYPACFRHDPNPPALVAWQGDLASLDGPRVAVVGTRRCTRYGHDVAYELGRDLAGAGVRVVSGLALGIDGAAHRGALDAGGAPPVAVVGAGLDITYPRRNAALWGEVRGRGVVLCEHPLGTPVAAWQFPARNRLIAALADVVVVVESHREGGALGTAEEGTARGRTVLAVPGSVRSPSSAGTNALLADGAGVCRGAHDVAGLLRLDSAALARAVERRPPPDGAGARVLGALAWEPASTEQLLERTGLPLGQLAAALDALEEQGWVQVAGGWCERVATPRDDVGAGRGARPDRPLAPGKRYGGGL